MASFDKFLIFLRDLLSGFPRLSPLKMALMSDTLRSRLPGAMKPGEARQGKGWLTEIAYLDKFRPNAI
jgi:hypothetical protein